MCRVIGGIVHGVSFIVGIIADGLGYGYIWAGN